MINKSSNNRVNLLGVVCEDPIYSHSLYGEVFYTFMLCVSRLSGAEDILPVMASERIIDETRLLCGACVALEGQLRSYNKHIDGANRLVITVFARSLCIEPENADPLNDIVLDGYICKPVIYRTTPFSREIADVLIAVNRSYNKSDYLPCIAWGRNARFAGQLGVGTRIMVTGRIQSRTYQKKLSDDEQVCRTAYEVSASAIEVIDI